MRFFVAIMVFLASAALILLGFAQRTIFLGPDTYSLNVDLPQETAVTLVDSSVLAAHPNPQRIIINGEGTVNVVYAKTNDVLAWLSNTSYSTVYHNPRTDSFQTRIIPGEEVVIPEVLGSDLWVEEFSADGTLRFALDISEGYTMMLSGSGEAGQLEKFEVNWSLDNSTPWAGPLMTAGIILLILGIVLYGIALREHRRKNGPRRRNPRPLNPRKAMGRERTTQFAPSRGRRAAGRRKLIAAGMLGSVMFLTSCSPSYWPRLDQIMPASGTAETPEQADPTAQANTAMPLLQFERVMAKIFELTDNANKELDAKTLEARYAGPALQLRKTNITLKARKKSHELPVELDPNHLLLFLPEQTESWPRSVLAVYALKEKSDNPGKQLVVLKQNSPRENYKVHYQINLLSDVPELPAASEGTLRVMEESVLLKYPLDQVFPKYAEILVKGDKADPDLIFDPENDIFRKNYGKSFKDERIKKKPKYANLVFSNDVKLADPIAFRTRDLGVLVIGYIVEYETVKPSVDSGTVSASGRAATLFRKSNSARGIKVGYGQQIVLYMPPVNSEEKIRSIGFTQGLVSAEEL